MTDFPRVTHQSALPVEDRITAVDFVNRVNWLFEVWDVDAMVESFLPESTTYHFEGTVHGHAGLRAFFRDDYPYLIPGVARHATNHIVDADGADGVVVRYHNLLVRYGSPDGTPGVLPAPGVVDSGEGLPAIWIYSPMLDRLRRTADGWRIFERYVGHSVIDKQLSGR
ncbi:MAG: nuclear transport factor 2 family protein [Mycobacterium sp.]